MTNPAVVVDTGDVLVVAQGELPADVRALLSEEGLPPAAAHG
jgi:hypothetical protein